MKSIFTVIALAGFAGVMLFGSFLMIHEASHASCLPTLMGTNECQSANPLEYVRVHIGALERLTNAIPAFSMLAAFAIIALLFYAGAFALRKPLLASQKYQLHRWDSEPRSAHRKFLKWFAIHEKRDPSLAFAASI